MLEVLYEDNHIIAINKKSGDIVQGDKTGDAPLSDFVKAYIKKKYNKPGEVFLGTIHRLDRPTSGVVLYARTSKDNAPANDSGTLENYLLKNQKQNKSYVTKGSDGKHAILDFKMLKKLDNFFHLEIKPKTGRHHQIRVQLAHIGCIIKGDLKYGAKRSNKDASIHLLAQKLEFIHPVKKESITIVAPAPKDSIWDAC
jgi:23S rRNA pseudouridine1911/1915/1917 synthase